MLSLIHQLASYLFLFGFVVACALSLLSLARKQASLERLSAWCFVASFGLLVVAYVCGFGPEAAIGSKGPVAQLAARHHDMAKFVLTGMTLISAASLTVLVRYRHQRFPGWFLPNLLFLALMIATFSIRSLVYAYQLQAHPVRHGQPVPQASPSSL